MWFMFQHSLYSIPLTSTCPIELKLVQNILKQQRLNCENSLHYTRECNDRTFIRTQAKVLMGMVVILNLIDFVLMKSLRCSTYVDNL